MKVTNKKNLPEYIFQWLVKDNYDHNHDPYVISTTTLMKPVKVKVLYDRYYNQLEVDASDLVASRLGSAIHDSMEQVEVAGVVKEERVSRIMEINGSEYTITGKFDVLELDGKKGILRDIKTTSTWAYIYGSKDEDYIKQLSIYRWLLQDQYEIEEGYIDFIFTDWQSSKAKQAKKDGDNYPQDRILPGYKIQLMSLEETEAYIRTRLELFDSVRDNKDAQLPSCTPDELWSTEEKFAVYKKGAKRASRVLDSVENAKKYMTTKKIDGVIQHRPAMVKRCKYCAAFPFCTQGIALNHQGLVVLD